MNVLLWEEALKIKTFNAKQINLLIAIAFFWGILGTLSIVKAVFLVHFDGLSIVALLQKLQPIVAIIGAYFFLKEKPTKHFLFWALVAIIATYFLVFWLQEPNFQANADYIKAMWFALLAALSFGIATVLWKAVVKDFSFQTVTYYRFGITAFLMFFVVLITGNISMIAHVTPINWMIFFVIAFTTGSGAIFLYYYGLKKVTAMTATLCELMFPVSTVIFDYLVNGKILHPIQIFAAIIILFSVVMIHLKK
jgi:drug/metabolite transporter (DMT)-like permease